MEELIRQYVPEDLRPKAYYALYLHNIRPYGTIGRKTSIDEARTNAYHTLDFEMLDAIDWVKRLLIEHLGVDYS